VLNPLVQHSTTPLRPMSTVTLARRAMGTRFELVLHGDDPMGLRAAGEEALEEIDRIEGQLSLYRSTSEIAHVNARAAKEPVRVSPRVFALLQQAQQLHQESGGAFDITIGALVRCWGFMGGQGRFPKDDELAEARANVGMHLLHLDSRNFTVRFDRQGVMLDLGAIGKGYAIERASEVLREAGVTSALFHGGTSTVQAIGHPPKAEFWTIGIEDPKSKLAFSGRRPHSEVQDFGSLEPSSLNFLAADGDSEAGNKREDALRALLATVILRDEALSVSAVSEKFFRSEGKILSHSLDPSTGEPAAGAVLAVVVLPSATETDAFSTALLTRGAQGHKEISKLRPDMRTLLVVESGGSFRVESNGIY